MFNYFKIFKMLLAGPICCGGLVPVALFFLTLVFMNFLITNLKRKEFNMEHNFITNNTKCRDHRVKNFLISGLSTTWAIGTSAAAAGVHIETNINC